MRKTFPISFLLFFLLLISCPLQSSISKRLQVFLTKNNISSNITEADFSHGGIMSLDVQGGSGFIRQEVLDINPVHVSFPKIQVGCGGIDYHLGAFNAVASGDIKNALLAMLKSGGTQLFLVGLKGVSPQTASAMETLQDWQNQLNGISINSCEAGRKLAEMSSDFVRNGSIKQTICSQMTNKKGDYSNLILSRKACAVEEDTEQTKEVQKTNNEIDKLIGSDREYNLADEIFSKLKITDKDDKNLYLNICGTIISTEKSKYEISKEEGARTSTIIETKNSSTSSEKCQNIYVFPARTKEIMGLLLDGGTLENSYSFSDGDPKGIVTGSSLTIPRQSTGAVRIYHLLKSMREKMIDEKKGSAQTFTDEEKKLFGETSFPIERLLIISAQTQGKATGSAVTLWDCSRLIALQKVSFLIEEILDQVFSTSRALEAQKMVENSQVKEFQDALLFNRRNLNIFRRRIAEGIDYQWNLINSIEQTERNQRTKSRF